jgi:hypothetical protein
MHTHTHTQSLTRTRAGALSHAHTLPRHHNERRRLPIQMCSDLECVLTGNIMNGASCVAAIFFATIAVLFFGVCTPPPPLLPLCSLSYGPSKHGGFMWHASPYARTHALARAYKRKDTHTHTHTHTGDWSGKHVRTEDPGGQGTHSQKSFTLSQKSITHTCPVISSLLRMRIHTHTYPDVHMIYEYHISYIIHTHTYPDVHMIYEYHISYIIL